MKPGRVKGIRIAILHPSDNRAAFKASRRSSFCFTLRQRQASLLIPKPAVVISDEGIFDNASAVGAGMLRWEEIADVFAYDFMGQRMLGIIPVNEEVVLGRQSRFKRVMAKMNRGIAPAPFNIPQNVLPISVDELLSRVEEYRRDPPVGRA